VNGVVFALLECLSQVFALLECLSQVRGIGGWRESFWRVRGENLMS
jgi:hypothetical protein